ncbi:MAG TPA: HlyD family efflux transporter periplasmic adaptor subunit [Candidatus Eremiobacteraeota bacterium]|nr:MAG: putative efflux system component YknX [bacterium ADurb.Bin363]HPZ07417.1 HlyD family efflux transporter periplasmic adaptor subunit [Candidatus Eremiobacteraeota bacterium]
MTKIKIFISIILLCIIGVFIFYKISDKYKIKPEEVTTDFPEVIKNFEIFSVRENGTVDVEVKREIFAEVSGFVDQIPVKEGDKVKAGQEILILKNPEIENKYQEGESKLKEAELNLRKVEENFEKEKEKNKLEEIQLEIALDDAEKQLTQTIVTCENREIYSQQEINAAERALKESQNNYHNLEKDISQVSQKEVDLKKKKIAKEEAEAEMKRSKELFDAKIISKKQWEDAQNKYNKASLDYDQSVKDFDSISTKRRRDVDLAELKLKEWEFRVESTKKQAAINKELNTRDLSAAMERVEKCKAKISLFPLANKLCPEDVEIAKEKVVREKKNFLFVRENYLKTKIKSPIDGEIILIDRLRTGGEVTQGTHCMVVGKVDKLIIKADLDDKDITSISVGQRVRIYGNGISKENALKGSVTAIESISGGKNTVSINFNIPENLKKFIRPYMNIKLDFISSSKEHVLVIASSSIVKKGDKTFVFLYDNGKAKEVEIKTGISDKDYTEIISGLTEKDKIITKWKDKLASGTPVISSQKIKW